MMTPKQIYNKRIQIDSKIDFWEDRLKDLQAECPHVNVKKTYKSNTGNYDPSADCYWTVFECPACDKIWHEDGSK